MLKAHRKDVSSLIKGKKGGPGLCIACNNFMSLSLGKSKRQGEGNQGEVGPKAEEES